MLSRVATFTSRANKDDAVIVENGEARLRISQAALATHDSAAKLKAELERLAQLSNVELPSIFFHVNRDGTVALATGQEPDIWPEDEPEEKE